MNIKKFNLVLEETQESYFFDGRKTLGSDRAVADFVRVLGIHKNPEEVVLAIVTGKQIGRAHV